MATSDVNQYNKAAGIAPTVTFDSFAPLDKRLRKLGDLLRIRHSADQWLEDYEMRLNRMWEELGRDLKQGESASVFIFTRGGRLFVMGRQGLSAILYHKSGFRVPEGIKRIVNKGLNYKEIELLRNDRNKTTQNFLESGF